MVRKDLAEEMGLEGRQSEIVITKVGGTEKELYQYPKGGGFDSNRGQANFSACPVWMGGGGGKGIFVTRD
jgi:hypothetical protein